MFGLPNDNKNSLVQGMEEVLQPLSPSDRPLFLQHLEREAKAKGDFVALRIIREYRKAEAEKRPPSTTPPEPA